MSTDEGQTQVEQDDPPITAEGPRRLYDLICEGQCNRDLPLQLDVIATKERLWQHAPSLATLSAIRRLRHTPHMPSVRVDVFICTQCGSERRYGKSI